MELKEMGIYTYEIDYYYEFEKCHERGFVVEDSFVEAMSSIAVYYGEENIDSLSIKLAIYSDSHVIPENNEGIDNFVDFVRKGNE